MFYSYRSPFSGLFFGQRSGAMRWFCTAIIHNLVIWLFFRGLSPERSEPIGEKSTITTCYVYIALGCFFFWRKCSTVVAVGVPDFFFALAGGLKQWFWKNNTVNVGWIAKSVTEKNNSRVDCAEADKKTVQAQRYEGRGFLAAGGWPAELPVINYQACLTAFFKLYYKSW